MGITVARMAGKAGRASGDGKGRYKNGKHGKKKKKKTADQSDNEYCFLSDHAFRPDRLYYFVIAELWA